MDLSEYCTLDATALAALLADGSLGAAEVADAARAAHRRTHPQLNAVLEWYADTDTDGPASAAEPTGAAGPWAGVPMLRKDYGAAEAGRLVERGSRLSRGWRSTHTDELMARFARLGPAVQGRTAVPEFILHATTESRVHGVTHNPWNPAFSPGGSSGGSAAAVAAGVVPLAHASDCAGSIRIPAAACGLIGLKPSRGRLPWGDGTAAGGWGGIAEEFVLTRSVRDAAFALRALGSPVSGPGGPTGPGGPGAPGGPTGQRSGRGRPIGLIVEHWAGAPADAALVAALDGAAAALTSAGHAVELCRWPVAYDEVASLMDPLFGLGAANDIAAVAAATGRPLDAEHLEPVTLAYLAVLAGLDPATLASARQRAAELSVRLDGWLQRFDAVLCSTLGRNALPLGRLGGEVAFEDWVAANDLFTPHSFVANVTGWPALSLPWGLGPHHLPIGIQLLATRGSDERLLELAEALTLDAPPLGYPQVWAGRDAQATPGSTQSIS